MVGSGASRLARVKEWVTDRADGRGEPVSIPLLCETAVLRLRVTGVTLTVDSAEGWPETRHSTDALGERLAELQVTVGEGPGIDVRRESGPVLTTDLDSPAGQRRWPLFAPLAVQAGARALFTLPLCVGAIRVGILALHRVDAGRLEPPVLMDALAFAELALVLLLDEQAGLRGPAPLDLPLHAPQVHQATGIVSAQLDVGMQDAFARLRARAFAAQRPLAELAADVVAHRVRFDRPGDAS